MFRMDFLLAETTIKAGEAVAHGPSSDSWNLLIEIVILLGACLLLGGICSRLRQSPLVGYLIAGMLLGGPGSINVIQGQHDIEAIAELGVALLLFSLGLEFSWERVKQLGVRALLAGMLQVLLTAMAFGAASVLFHVPWKESIVIGAMFSLSSTAAVLRVLVEEGELDGLHGRNSLAVLLVQDMAVVPLAILMTLLAQGGTPQEVAIHVGKVLGLATALIVGLYVLLNFVAVRFMIVMSLERNRELSVVLAIVCGLGATWSAHSIGLSPALGAFVAGMFLGSSPFATQVRSDVSSLKTVLLTLFFGAVGIVADPIWIFNHILTVLLLSAGILAIKMIILGAILQFLGFPRQPALASAICLSQVGEFAFVLGTTAKQGGILQDETYRVLVSSAIMTLLATPYLVRTAPLVASLIERSMGKRKSKFISTHQNEKFLPDVVIVGFGPAGQAIANEIKGYGVKVLILELNPTVLEAAKALGLEAQIGDATQHEVLIHAHIESAKLIVVTLPARVEALTVLSHCRILAPDAQIVVRSRYQRHQTEFSEAGAHAVFGDEQEVANRIASHVRAQVHKLSQLAKSDT